MTIDRMAATIEVRVSTKWREAIDIDCLELVDDCGAPLPAFSAGSHIDVHLPGGLIRQYSLCNESTERHRYLISVLRDPNSRGGSRAVHDRVSQGDVLRISKPRNHFELSPARRYLLFAGGIGVTPILCMAERLSRIGADFSMHYCTRSPERMAFTNRIENSGYGSRVHKHFDDGSARQKLRPSEILNRSDNDTHIYVCGPNGFMNWIIENAKSSGWPDANIHYEYFAPKASSEAGSSFEVELASDGRVLTVPQDKSIVSILNENGIGVPVSCEAGVCGTCLTRVLSGTPDHRDVFLTDQERARNDQITPCCSRAISSRLVLDL